MIWFISSIICAVSTIVAIVFNALSKEKGEGKIYIIILLLMSIVCFSLFYIDQMLV